MDGLIHGEHVTPGFRVGVFGPDSVHLAGPGVWMCLHAAAYSAGVR